MSAVDSCLAVDYEFTLEAEMEKPAAASGSLLCGASPTTLAAGWN